MPNDLPPRPKKPLSAYNYFFKAERARVLGLNEDEIYKESPGKKEGTVKPKV